MFNQGDILGENTIVSRRGGGSFGEVFSCQNPDHSELIALKVCKPGISQEEEQRFFQENEILYKLINHSRIVSPLSQVNKENNYIYYIMELADFNLEGYWGKYYENDTKFQIELFKKICDGLKYAHSSDIAHRDLWWNNILINGKEKNVDIKISDFGRAKDFSLNIIDSKTFCFGHIYILPPEAYFKIWDFSDKNNIKNYKLGDLYALGIIFYYILTISSTAHSLELKSRIGSYLIRNNINLDLLDYSERKKCYNEWIQNQKNFPFSTLVVTLNDPVLSLEINTIINKLCNIDYTLRYSDVDELIKDLENLNI